MANPGFVILKFIGREKLGTLFVFMNCFVMESETFLATPQGSAKSRGRWISTSAQELAFHCPGALIPHHSVIKSWNHGQKGP